MTRYRVVLVEPRYDGNIGSVARAMMNFEQDELILVRPPELGDEAKERAMHAWPVVESARTVTTFEAAIAGADYVVGTSARIPRNDKEHMRNPIDARDLPHRVHGRGATVALCFGREDYGLFNDELQECDVLVTIPTRPTYRSMNLSHAVTILLYELSVYRNPDPHKTLRPMSGVMKQTFEHAMDVLIDDLRLPAHKNRQTKLVYRRVFGRAALSAWEYFVFMGILSDVLKKYGRSVGTPHSFQEFDFEGEVAAALQSTLESSSSNSSS